MRHTTGSEVCRHASSGLSFLFFRSLRASSALRQAATWFARNLMVVGPISGQQRHERLPLAPSQFLVNCGREWSVFRVEPLLSFRGVLTIFPRKYCQRLSSGCRFTQSFRKSTFGVGQCRVHISAASAGRFTTLQRASTAGRFTTRMPKLHLVKVRT